eukprot:CAMPEP_0171113666 /NCGR_PEP_ID=MMETSP0766_2-20121228/83145_1 /TAXON_ID=439317 /ORGANISM="Gambierdiscus australes, Strain CAWD 149" /LENGTH=92 /DNA_ID=CAMNT_0011575895 /DNA_START=15 /DNA_END=293 /DNA_ORIENTATION=+
MAAFGGSMRLYASEGCAADISRKLTTFFVQGAMTGQMKSYDADHDGSFNPDELSELMIDSDVSLLCRVCTSCVVGFMDKNKNGRVELDEFHL